MLMWTSLVLLRTPMPRRGPGLAQESFCLGTDASRLAPAPEPFGGTSLRDHARPRCWNGSSGHPNRPLGAGGPLDSLVSGTVSVIGVRRNVGCVGLRSTPEQDAHVEPAAEPNGEQNQEQHEQSTSGAGVGSPNEGDS